MKKTLQRCVVVAALAVTAGVFLPLASVPLYGVVTYHRVTAIGSFVVVLFALLALVFLYRRQPRWVVISALGVWSTLLFPVLQNAIRRRHQGLIGRAVETTTEPLREVAVQLFLKVTRLHWGGYVFLLGCAVFAMASLALALQPTTRRSRRR